MLYYIGYIGYHLKLKKFEKGMFAEEYINTKKQFTDILTKFNCNSNCCSIYKNANIK